MLLDRAFLRDTTMNQSSSSLPLWQHLKVGIPRQPCINLSLI